VKTGNLYETLTKYEILGKLREFAFSIFVALSADIILLFCLFSLDNILNFNSWFRLFSVALLVVLNISLAAWYVYLFIFRKLSAHKLALKFEKEYGIKDNSIINAVCFKEDEGMPDSLRNLFVNKASENCRKIKLQLSAVLKNRNLGRVSRIFLISVIVFIAYSAVFHRYARNAFLRFMNPYSQLASLNYTQFNVSPGDIEIIEGDSRRIVSNARRGDVPAKVLSVIVQNEGAADVYEMIPSAKGFFLDLKNITSTLRYSVRNRHESSRWFTISVIKKPRFDNVSVIVNPPGYTGEKGYALPLLKKNAEILKGSMLNVEVKVPKGYKASFFVNGRILADADKFEYKLSTTSVFNAVLANGKGLENQDAWSAEFSVVDDRVPEIRFLNTNTNIEMLIGEKLPIHIYAEDDFCVKNVDVYMETPAGDKILKSFKYGQNKKNMREVWTLTADKATFTANASYKIWARATDNFPGGHTGVTQVPLSIHVVDNLKMLAGIDKNDSEGKMYSYLIKALGKQKDIQNMLAEKLRYIRNRNEILRIEENQAEVHELIGSASVAAAALMKKGKISEPMLKSVNEIKDGISSKVLKEVKEAVKDRKDENLKTVINNIILSQGELIARLEEILGIMALGKKEAEQMKEEVREELQDLAFLEKLKSLKKEIDKFKDEQKMVIDKTEELDKRNPEDWTKKMEEILGDLSAREADLAKFFKAEFNDLSKLGRQDFSNSKMAEELVEMYEELQKAGDALKKKENIEIATLNESAALETAESIEQNLERWLADKQDGIKWNAEQGEDSPDVNMTDLPNELTDIIGELIESEDDMSQENEDSTNSTMWDKDDGIGWRTGDGNINSMQAKGITGNVLPNNNEVGGRSGEGRSGKSSGQFVEKEATGKGGRVTPTRLTESPFEEGTVKDTSKDPGGGATGGGKQSGIGNEGLRGKTPDNNRDLEQRLPGKQVELKQKAEALLRKLTVQNLPTGDLEDAISKMEQLSKYNSKGKGLNFRQAKDDVISSLLDAKSAVNEAVKSDIDKNAGKKKKDFSFKYNSNENTPAGYEDTVEAYFKSLAAGDE
jgi:hypothetical protein